MHFHKLFLIAISIAAFFTPLALAQFSGPGTRIVESGYRSPSPKSVAAGQLVTIYVLGMEVEPAAASATPLPRALAGVSARLRDARGGFEADLPILSVAPGRADFWLCGPDPTACPQAAITLQIPTEIALCRREFGCPEEPGTVYLRSGRLNLAILRNGETIDEMQFFLADRNVHVRNVCDEGFAPFQSLHGICMPLVTHADGSLIGSPWPAKPGETVTLYAVGLGRTIPQVPTGQVAPPEGAPQPTSLAVLLLRFDRETSLDLPPSLAAIEPEYVGLVGGFVGLYQMNFKVPDAIPVGTPGCGAFTGGNLTITVIADDSRDEASICVAP